MGAEYDTRGAVLRHHTHTRARTHETRWAGNGNDYGRHSNDSSGGTLVKRTAISSAFPRNFQDPELRSSVVYTVICRRYC